MTSNQNNQKPLVTDLWLLVDEEQTLHFGMRQAWRWSEAEQLTRRPARETAIGHTCSAHAQPCCHPTQVACAA